VQRVLHEIGAAAVPQLVVFNKIDALPDGQRPLNLVDRYEVEGVQATRVFASSLTGEGLPELRRELARIVHASAPLAAEAPGSS